MLKYIVAQNYRTIVKVKGSNISFHGLEMQLQSWLAAVGLASNLFAQSAFSAHPVSSNSHPHPLLSSPA